jgi:hypothetical protein
MGPQELFTRAFERGVEAVSGRKTTHVFRDPDPFDGTVYALDEWDEFTRPFFARPADFFRDFAPAGGIDVQREQGGRPTAYGRYAFATPLASDEPANDRVPFWWFRDATRRAGTVALVAPGWARPDRKVESAFCARLVARGVDALLLTPPYHHERTPPGCYSGELFISANVFWTIANFRQFTAEIRLLVQYMRRYYDRVVLIGFSSGGFQTGLAALGEEVDGLVALMTGCRLGSITFHSLLARFVKRDALQRGIDEAALNRVWRICDLAAVGHALRARHVKQYVTLYDAIVPTRYQEALWEVFGRPERRDVPSSHYGVVFHLYPIADDIATWIQGTVA